MDVAALDAALRLEAKRAGLGDTDLRGELRPLESPTGRLPWQARAATA